MLAQFCSLLSFWFNSVSNGCHWMINLHLGCWCIAKVKIILGFWWRLLERDRILRSIFCISLWRLSILNWSNKDTYGKFQLFFFFFLGSVKEMGEETEEVKKQRQASALMLFKIVLKNYILEHFWNKILELFDISCRKK